MVTSGGLHPELLAWLRELRLLRSFDGPLWVRAKTELLNDYFRRHGLRAAVLGVSGGVDSALTLAILAHAKGLPGSPIERIVPALIPIFGEGSTSQEVATTRGQEVAARFGAAPITIDLSDVLGRMRARVQGGLGLTGGPWAAGQLVSYLRTPALYFLASLLTEQGLPAVVVGTTNRDEGSYIGFFGKASDGMVDLQPLSDLHKSEVHLVAELLGVPETVRRAVPTGNTFDGRPDEVMIGAPYDFVELYTLALAQGDGQMNLPSGLSYEAQEQLRQLTERVEALHRANLHKYLGDSPAVHLDVYERAVPGGWSGHPPKDLAKLPAPQLVCPIELGKDVVEPLFSPLSRPPRAERVLDYGDSLIACEGVLTGEECDAFYREIAGKPRAPVGIDGRPAGFSESRDPIGSYRSTACDERLAAGLWQRIASLLPRLRIMGDDTPTDCGGHRVWRATGLNPVMRFIWYEGGGWLVPHYDAGFDFRDGRRHTLMSLVLFLTDAVLAEGGATRFLREKQRHLPLSARSFSDRNGPAAEGEALASFQPRRGAALVFDHRLPHEVQPWRGPSPRLVLRTDVIFERCGLAATSTHSAPAPQPSGSDADVRIERDPTFGPARAILGTREALEEAGYFDDGSAVPLVPDLRRDPEWLVTPIHKLVARLSALAAPSSASDAGVELVVLLSTGAFYPLHLGHLELMESARAELLQRGMKVLAGYFSPDHDDYVVPKCAPDVPCASHRVSLAERAVEGIDWLMVDPSNALHADRALNFTEVAARLEAYLSAHVHTHRPIRVAYVFGGDNARFSLAFVSRGLAVCVPRLGFEDRWARYEVDPRLKGRANIIFARGKAPRAASSRLVRQGDDTHLPQGAQAEWRAWQTGRSRGRTGGQMTLFLRDEGRWSLEPWLKGRDHAALDAALNTFRAGLLAALRKAFVAVQPPDTPRQVQIRLLSLDEQKRGATKLLAGRRVISLDPCIPGDFNLGVSRCFEISSDSGRPGIVARPGWPPLAEQVERIPAGEYVLFDDDQATGQTITSVKALLAPHRQVTQVATLCELDGAGERMDLADCRDFIAGARDGGLVVALPDGTLGRAPYVAPYVRLFARLGIPVSAELELSCAIWKLNRELFQAIRPAVRLAEASPSFLALVESVGLDRRMSLQEVSEWHVRRL